MHALYDLKDKLCKELEEYGKKGDLSAGSLDVVDKLAHTIKNLDKIIEVYEDEDYSNYGGSYDYRGRSYARRRDSMGRYSRDGYPRDGYSRTGDIAEKLRALANEAPDERSRKEIHDLISRMEMM